jgi:hypothetical protein
MKFTSINTNLDITNKTAIKAINKKDKIFPLEISAYIEEENFSRHITLNISPDIETDGFDIWLDLDICQAELLAMKIKELCINRRKFLINKMKEE